MQSTLGSGYTILSNHYALNGLSSNTILILGLSKRAAKLQAVKVSGQKRSRHFGFEATFFRDLPIEKSVIGNLDSIFGQDEF